MEVSYRVREVSADRQVRTTQAKGYRRCSKYLSRFANETGAALLCHPIGEGR